MPAQATDAATAGVPDVVEPPPGHPRFARVDALRAIAALTVLLTHTGFASAAALNPTYGAYLGRLEAGVALFFLISGFLLYRPFVARRLNGAPAIRLRDYTRRRLLRIVPAYWLALTVLAIFPGLPAVFSGHWWVYYGFLQVYNDNWVLNGIGPAWSLCIEISFYALLPLYAWLVTRALRGRDRGWQVRLELLALAAIFAASLAYRYWLRRHVPLSPVLNTLPTHMDWFAVGMALAVVSAALEGLALEGLERRPLAVRVIARWPALCWLAAIAAFWAVSRRVGGPQSIVVSGHLTIQYTGRQDLARHVLYALAALGLLLPAVIASESGGLVRRLLATRTLAWLGLISYGIYLWQTPLLAWICQPAGGGTPACRFRGATVLEPHPFLWLTLISGAVIVACAAASYYLLEKPLLRFKYRSPRRPRALPVAEVAEAEVVA